jgi:DNA-3-methyladenine glycosylase II
MTAPIAETTIHIEPRGPFNWDTMIDSLASFPPTERHWRGTAGAVRMAFPLDGDFAPVAVALRWDGDALSVEATGSDRHSAIEAQVARIFTLDCDGSAYPAVGERDPEIGRLMSLRPGQRPLSFTSPYECAAWGILSQRIAAKMAARVQHRLIEAHGSTLEIAGERVMSFPTPEQLLGVTEFRGIPEEKLTRLHAVARAAQDGLLDAATLRAVGRDEAVARLQSIRGIGPFWAQMIYLRACGIHDEFPDEPLAIAALGRLHNLGDRPSPADVERLTDLYRPYRMWVCYLLRVCQGRGLIGGPIDATAIRRAARRK